jgi:malonyl CoA-acyl carrier protein transacylase
MLFSLQYASAKSWLDSGIQVDTIVGHSFGQLTALVVANALSLSDGLRIISARARLIQESWGNETGAMLSVQGDRSHVVKLLDVALSQSTDFSVDIACYNGPDSVVLAGDKTSIDAVEKVAESEEFSTSLKMIRLKNTHAFHSRLTDPILPGLAEVAQTLRFKKPTIRIEACSRDQDWNKSLTAEMIVQHSRDPVYFDVAIQRIAQRLDSCVFIEAGSASPIVPMARKALINTNSDNLYMPIDIGRPKALSKLAAATCSLWEAGIKVQYWPFHHSQSNSFTWINLPPYQFHKSTHWMPYVAQIAEAPKEAVPIEKNETLQLLDFLERTSQGNTFRVNCTHEIFKLCTNGHAVLGQSLCPASMYVEIAVRAASSLAVGKYSPMAPYVKELSISAPLSINAGQTVLLQLEPISSEQDTWKFSIVSSGQLKSSTSIEHATGIVSLVMSEKYFQASRIEFLERLVGQDRRESLLSAPGSNILNGNIVYQVFGQVVDYAAYYRGIGEIVSKNNQAMGVVNLPKVQFPIMNEANCDPITLDNFLQVAGVHVNCLSEKNEDEVFICTKLGELFLSGKFIEKRREMLSWNVYSSFKKSSDKTLVNDIFVFDPQTGDLLIVFLGAIFQSVSLKSLARTLSKLNGTFSPNSSQSSGKVVIEQSLKAKPEYEAAMTKVTSNVQDTVHVNGTSYSSPSETLQKLRQLLSKVIEIPIEDVQPTATLAEVGIDSLMSTDVLNEIKAQFNVEISASDFLELTSVQSIAQKLSGSTTFVAQDLAMPLQTQQKPTISANAGQVTDASSLRQIQELFSDILEVPISEVGANTLLSDLGVDSLMATEILTEIQKLFDVTIELDELQDFPDIGSLAQRLGMWSSEVSNAIPTPATQSNGPNPDEVFAVADEKPFASVARESFGMVQREFDMISRDTNLESFYETVYPSQMELVVAYVVEAFDSLGCALGSLPVGASVPDIKILKEHSKVKNQLYRMLEVENIIKQDSAGKFVRTATPVPQASSKSLFNSIMSQFPQHIYEHSLLASTGSDLAGCLTGRINPLSILFGSAKARTLMENVYTHAPMFKTGTINLARYLVKIFNNFKENRPIRILELGAGTGGTSKYLVEALTATSQPFEYTFTDLSASLVAAARKKFAHYSNMKYTVFNIEEEPAPQFLGQYDIVISTNCIHATRDLSRSCTNINKVLSPDGILCLVELTRNLYWFDLVFGLLEGWWLFEDGRQHALANEQLWRKHLSRSRFRWVDWTVGASEESNLLRIITASPSELVPLETVEFKKVGDVSLQADIYYPSNDNSQKVLPVGELPPRENWGDSVN